MRKITSILLGATMAMSFIACSDDSSSSNNFPTAKFFLDEEHQNFGLIRDLCFISDGNARWDEYADTSYYHYEFVDDYLVLYNAGNSADNGGKIKTDFDDDKYMMILKSKNHDGIFGTWKEAKCNLYDGEIDCDRKDDEFSDIASVILEISNDDIRFTWSTNADYCPVNELVETEEIEFFFEDILEDAEVTASSTSCNSTKLKVNGISITLEIDESIGNDNVRTTTTTVSNKNNICSYTEKSVPEDMRYPKSVCNTKDMEHYIAKFSKSERNGYVYEYKNGAIGYDNYLKCIRQIFDEAD